MKFACIFALYLCVSVSFASNNRFLQGLPLLGGLPILGNIVPVDLNNPTADLTLVLNFVKANLNTVCNLTPGALIKTVQSVLVQDILGTVLGLLGSLLQSIIGKNYSIVYQLEGTVNTALTVVAQSIPNVNGVANISVLSCN